MAEYDGPTYADNPYNSPLRRWIYDYMRQEFPTNDKVYRSDSPLAADRLKFELWTGTTQKSLMKIWESKGTFSTCTGFIAILVTRIRQNGGLMPKNGAPPVFQTFDLALNKKGWHRYPEKDRQPRLGDIFALGKPLAVKHVGIVLNSVGSQWITIEAGGGTIGQYQSIARNGWHAPPFSEMYGWIDIDEYFDTWSNPNYS